MLRLSFRCPFCHANFEIKVLHTHLGTYLTHGTRNRKSGSHKVYLRLPVDLYAFLQHVVLFFLIYLFSQGNIIRLGRFQGVLLWEDQELWEWTLGFRVRTCVFGGAGKGEQEDL